MGGTVTDPGVPDSRRTPPRSLEPGLCTTLDPGSQKKRPGVKGVEITFPELDHVTRS